MGGACAATKVEAATVRGTSGVRSISCGLVVLTRVASIQTAGSRAPRVPQLPHAPMAGEEEDPELPVETAKTESCFRDQCSGTTGKRAAWRPLPGLRTAADKRGRRARR